MSEHGELRVDLFTIVAVVWRHRLVTALVVAATLVGSVAVVIAAPPVWSATTSYLLIEPPAPPSPEQLQENPRLKQLNADNPFARYGDPSVIIDVVSRIAATTSVQNDVEEAGGASDFEVLPSARFGAASPIIDVTVTGNSEELVLSSLTLVGDYVGRLLRQVQGDEAVSPRYFYTLRQINSPSEAKRELSSTLRLLVGVVALGGLTLVIALSTLEGRRRRRELRFADNESDEAGGSVGPDDTALREDETAAGDYGSSVRGPTDHVDEDVDSDETEQTSPHSQKFVFVTRTV